MIVLATKNAGKLREIRALLAEHAVEVIAEVAYSCGFTHQSYFTELFAKKFGCTPMQYRKRQEVEFAGA